MPRRNLVYDGLMEEEISLGESGELQTRLRIASRTYLTSSSARHILAATYGGAASAATFSARSFSSPHFCGIIVLFLLRSPAPAILTRESPMSMLV